MKQFKIRPSSISKIMGKSPTSLTDKQKETLRIREAQIGLSDVDQEKLTLLKAREKGLTDKQKSTLAKLLEIDILTPAKKKDFDSLANRNTPLEDEEISELNKLTSMIKRTPAQDKEYEDLKEKNKAPLELPKGSKTYCEMWVKEQLYQRRKEISNKFLTRGNMSEDESIVLIGKFLNYPMYLKNETTFENEYIVGTPDIDEERQDLIIDAKSSWDFATHPLFVKECNPDYAWQVQGYMDLCGRSRAKVIHTLVDLPEELRQDEVRKLRYSGMNEPDAIDKVAEHHSYGDLPLSLKVKEYNIARDDNKIKAIHQRVIMCRAYIKTLVEGMK